MDTGLTEDKQSGGRPRREVSKPGSGTESEAHWIERAKAGDLDAFDDLVRLHFGRVYALLFRMIGNHEDAEDLAQECFIKAQKSLNWFRGDAAFSTWLYRIAVHQSRDHFRRSQRAPRVTPVIEEADAPSPHQGPVDESTRREFSAGLRASLERLPHKLRAALVMRTQEGMDYEHIAEVLEVNPQTARVHVMKARRTLERLMRPFTGEDDR